MASPSATKTALALFGPTYEELAARDPLVFEAFSQLAIGQSIQQRTIQSTQAAQSPIGGAKTLAQKYTAVAADDGMLLAFNGKGLIPFKLPAKPPSSTWKIYVQNYGAANVVLKASANSGPKLNGKVNQDVVLKPGDGAYITTDGTDYFTR